MIKKSLFIFFVLLMYSLPQAGTNFHEAAKNTLEVDSGMERMKFLHFTFTFEPRFREGQLTDFFYKIDYEEVGTGYIVPWVRLYDGHIINLREANSQWKGPFTGIRGIRYKFYFELLRKPDYPDKSSLRIYIFSTNPEIDAKYYNSFYKKPFTVVAYYNSLKSLKTAVQVYDALSTIYTIYRVATKGIGNPYTFVLSTVAEAVVIYAVEKAMDDMPVVFNITCNSCGKSYQDTRYNFDDFFFECKTEGCRNRAKIIFSD